jgi:low temperature requirement protein LtrA
VKRIRRLPHEEGRVTSAELFFDLVFVFVVTQLSARLVHDLTIGGAAKTMFLLLAAWWAWVYTTWVTNWFDAGTLAVRAILLVAMLAGLLGAVSIPDAFGDRAPLLVAGYVGIQTLRNVFVVVVMDRDDALYRPVQRILAWTCAVAPWWIAGALVHDEARIAVWSVALALDYAAPFAGHWVPGLGRSQPRDWQLEPSHFIERLELFLIIALGESIVAAGATASNLEPTPGRLTALLVSVLMTTAFWWLYFDFHAGRTLERLRSAGDERGRLGRDLSYLYVVLVAGILVSSVGDELVIAHPGAHPGAAELVAIAAGPAVYLLGSVALKVRVLRVRWERRAIATALIVVATALGESLPFLALYAIILLVLIALAGVEAVDTRRLRRERGVPAPEETGAPNSGSSRPWGSAVRRSTARPGSAAATRTATSPSARAGRATSARSARPGSGGGRFHSAG